MIVDDKYKKLKEKAQSLIANDKTELNKSISNDINELLEELNVYKIELDLQNQELRKSYNALEFEKRRYESLYMESPVAYFTLNQTGNIIEMNNEASDLLGLAIHQAKHTSIFPYLTEESKIKLNRFYKKIIANDESDTEEIVFIHSNGTMTYTNVKAVNCPDCKTDEMNLRFAVTNQTIIKEYEKQLAEQKKVNEIMSRYEILFNSSLSGIAVSDTQGIILECNDSFIHMLGYKKEDLIGNNIGNFTHPEDLNEEISNLKSMNKKYSKTRYEKRYIRKDGGIVWADISMTVLLVGDEPVYYLAVINNITDSIKFQEIILKNELKFKTIVQNIPDIVFHLNKDSVFLDFYQDRDDLLFKPEEFLNKSVFD